MPLGCTSWILGDLSGTALAENAVYTPDSPREVVVGPAEVWRARQMGLADADKPGRSANDHVVVSRLAANVDGSDQYMAAGRRRQMLGTQSTTWWRVPPVEDPWG